jgi:hypothetical protein
MARLAALLMLTLALPLLGACQDANAGFGFVDQLQSLGGAFQPEKPAHAPPHGPGGCAADETPRRCP